MDFPFPQDRLQQIEEEYWKIQYPHLVVDDARKAAGRPGDPELTYGTTSPALAVELLALAGAGQDDVFYDLGCGLGVPTLVAAVICRRAVGIEILPELIETGRSIAAALGLTNASFQVADLKTADLSDATVVYSYSTCLGPRTREQLAVRAALTRPGTRILTVTHPLEHEALELRSTQELSWEGSARTVYLHLRR